MFYFSIYYDTRKQENKTEYMLEYFSPRIEHFILFEMMTYFDTSVRT